MKLVPAIVFLYFLLITTMIFNSMVPANAQTGYALINNTTIQNSSSPFSTQTYYSFWYMFIDPTQLSSSAIWTMIVLSVLGLGVGVAVSVATKSDLGTLIAVFVIIFGSGVLAMIPTYQVVYSNIYELSVNTGTCTLAAEPAACKVPILLSAILFGPLALYWFFVCLEWWTARSTS
jgi:hypothetical protein